MDDLSRQPIEFLLEGIESTDPEVRRDVALVLGQRVRAGDQASIAPLIRLLADSDGDVAEAARDSLRGQPLAASSLIGVLGDRDAPLAARFRAATALTSLRDQRVVPAMLDVLRNDADTMALRRVLARYAGRTRDDRVREPLLDLLANGDADGEMRLKAAAGLEELGDPRAIAPLEHLLQQPDVWILTDARQREIERMRVLQEEARGQLAEDFARLNEEASRGSSLHHAIREALRLIKEYPARS